MAQLGERFLIQQIGGEVILFERYTERELIRFNPTDANEAAKAQGSIHLLAELNPEEKSFAHFWSGYFYAHATLYTAPSLNIEGEA